MAKRKQTLRTHHPSEIDMGNKIDRSVQARPRPQALFILNASQAS